METLDVFTFAAATALILPVALAAVRYPARRAMQVALLETIRYEQPTGGPNQVVSASASPACVPVPTHAA